MCFQRLRFGLARAIREIEGGRRAEDPFRGLRAGPARSSPRLLPPPTPKNHTQWTIPIGGSMLVGLNAISNKQKNIHRDFEDVLKIYGGTRFTLELGCRRGGKLFNSHASVPRNPCLRAFTSRAIPHVVPNGDEALLKPGSRYYGELAGAVGFEPTPSALTVRCPTGWTTPQ